VLSASIPADLIILERLEIRRLKDIGNVCKKRGKMYKRKHPVNLAKQMESIRKRTRSIQILSEHSKCY
jgi:uncharacterized protein YjiS (DUF1127 family)